MNFIVKPYPKNPSHRKYFMATVKCTQTLADKDDCRYSNLLCFHSSMCFLWFSGVELACWLYQPRCWVLCWRCWHIFLCDPVLAGGGFPYQWIPSEGTLSGIIRDCCAHAAIPVHSMGNNAVECYQSWAWWVAGCEWTVFRIHSKRSNCFILFLILNDRMCFAHCFLNSIFFR